MSRVVTYSPAYTLVPTYECFNRCAYCNFRVNPGEDTWMSLSEAQGVLEQFRRSETVEILILSGEVHPESRRRGEWLQRVYDLAQMSLQQGFLPHTNVGPLKWEEMRKLRSVNVSMGLMLEQVNPDLLQTVHRFAPSKRPEVRSQQVEWAGMLRIPFTTGLLLGIGETQQDWIETLEAIASLHRRYHHIQEVILQPYSPGSSEALQAPGFDLEQLPVVVQLARRLLPEEITLQIPPNLVTYPGLLVECLTAGARDLGGIGLVDEVNPDYPHPQMRALQRILEPMGWHLQPRLPVYPQFEKWLSLSLQQAVSRWRTKLG